MTAITYIIKCIMIDYELGIGSDIFRTVVKAEYVTFLATIPDGTVRQRESVESRLPEVKQFTSITFNIVNQTIVKCDFLS